MPSTDIDANRLHEQRAAAVDLLADLIENSTVGVHLQDVEGRILHANATLAAMTGFTPAQLRGRKFAEFLSDAAASMPRLLAAGESITNLEASITHRDGSTREILISANALWDAGRFIHARCFTRDVTELKASQTRLADAAARYRAILEASLDAIVTMDSSGHLVELNSAAERTFGYARSAAIGRPLAELVIPPHLREAHQRGLERYLQTGEGPVLGRRIEVVALHADGHEFPVELSIAVVRLEPPLFTATLRDITQRKLAEQELDRALQSLKDADRKKDEFIATLGHELRNPLAPVRNAASLLRMAGLPPERVAWAAEVIHRQVAHMARLLDDLLDVARVTRGKLELHKEIVQLDDVVAFALEIAKPLIESTNHSVELQLPSPPLRLEADAARVSQVLANLLTNAAKYSEPGKPIRLRAHVRDLNLVIEVEDEGIGFDPARHDEIFSMFSQLPESRGREHGGLGIGLALSRGIAELHGGTLVAHSAGPGRGSTFVLTLPISRPA